MVLISFVSVLLGVIVIVIVPEQNFIRFMWHAFKEELCKSSFAVTFKFIRSTVLSTEFMYLHSDTTLFI